MGLTDSLVRRARGLWHRIGVPAARLVYHQKYAASPSGVPLDPARSALVLAFLAREGLVARDDVRAPRAASMQDIRRVHTDPYLESLLEPPTLQNILGTTIAEPQIDEILDVHRLMVGGTILATKLALSSNAIGVNLGGGFHHARPDRGHGFCVYDDVAIAVARLRRGGFTKKILVVDLDLHDGDGTRIAFESDPTVHTFSMHNHTWSETPAVEATVIELGAGFDDTQYLAALDQALPPLIARFDPRLVIYVAGNDVAADDRLGDAKLSARGILERDTRVLSWVRGGARVRPLAVVLGGGYGPDTWRYTARFLALALGAPQLEPPSTDDMQLARMRYLARLIDPEALSGDDGDDGWQLSEEDLGGALGYSAKRMRLLGYYTRPGAELALERLGFFDHLRALGFAQPCLELEPGNETGDLVRIFGDASRLDLLVELRLRKDNHLVAGYEVLFVEWLLLQNPRLRFTAARPAMPGQAYPGLGLLAEVMSLLRVICERLHLQGIALAPGHYHVAARALPPIGFVDPVIEAHFRSLRTALSGLDLVQASWAIDQGHVRDRNTGKPARWIPKPMLLPLGDAIAEDAQGAAWASAVEDNLRDYVLDPAPAEGG